MHTWSGQPCIGLTSSCDILHPLGQEIARFRIWRGKHFKKIWMENNAHITKDYLKYFLSCPSFAEESTKLGMKQQENVDSTVERVKYEEHPVQKALEAKASETKEHKPKEILFPDAQLFRQWGEGPAEKG